MRRLTDLTAVLSVDIRDLGAGQVTDDDAVTMAVQERLALRVLVQHYGLAPLSTGQTGERPTVGDSLSSSHLSDGLCSAILHGQYVNINIISSIHSLIIGWKNTIITIICYKY